MSDETLTINDEQIASKKMTYSLDQENLARTINFFQEEIKKDEELLQALSRITGIDESKISDALEDEVESNELINMTLNLYTNNWNNIIAGSLEVEEESIVRFTNIDKEFKMIIGDKYTNFSITSIDDTVTISYNEYEEEVMNLIITSQNDTVNIKITANDYGSSVSLEVDLSNIKEEKESYQADLKINANIDEYGSTTNLELNGSLEIVKKELDNMDIENTVDINTLSEEDQAKITDNLMRIIEKLGLSNSLISI